MQVFSNLSDVVYFFLLKGPGFVSSGWGILLYREIKVSPLLTCYDKILVCIDYFLFLPFTSGLAKPGDLLLSLLHNLLRSHYGWPFSMYSQVLDHLP